MLIDVGDKFEISETIRDIYNRSTYLTVVGFNGRTVQFSLGEGKGHGSMPIQHFQYLLRRAEIKPIITNKKQFIEEQEVEKGIS